MTIPEAKISRFGLASACLTLPFLLALGSPANAATVRVEADYGDERTDVTYEGLLLIAGRRGEANRIVVRERARQTFEVRDSGAPLRIGKSSKDAGRCRRRSRHAAICRVARRPYITMVDAGDRDDSVVLNGAKADVAGGRPCSSRGPSSARKRLLSRRTQLTNGPVYVMGYCHSFS